MAQVPTALPSQVGRANMQPGQASPGAPQILTLFPEMNERMKLSRELGHKFRTVLASVPPIYPAQDLIKLREQSDWLRNKMFDLHSQLDILHPDDPRRQKIRDEISRYRVEYELRFWRNFSINDLPTEIILEIFRFTCWSPNSDSVRSRTTVSTTCRLWRGLALGDSMLWASIMFSSKTLPCERALVWLERAGRSALNIRFDDDRQLADMPPDTDVLMDQVTPPPPPSPGITDEEMSFLLDKVFDKVYQIESLIFILKDWAPILTFIGRLSDIAARGRPLILKRFEMHRTGDLYVWPRDPSAVPNHPITQYPVIGGPVAPKLDYLVINAIHFEWQASSISNLTTLDLRRLPLELAPTREVFRLMLRKCPLLRRLQLDGAGPNRFFDADFEARPIPMNHLRTMLLCNFSPEYAKGILQHFVAPNLVELQLLCYLRNDYGNVYEYMTGRFPNVKLLTLLNMEIRVPSNMEFFTRFLMSMPNVQYLRMSELTDGAVAALLYDTSDEDAIHPHSRIPQVHREVFARAHAPHMEETGTTDPFFVFPKLRVLEIKVMPLRILLALVESRQALGLHLEKLYLLPEMTKEIQFPQTPQILQGVTARQLTRAQAMAYEQYKQSVDIRNSYITRLHNLSCPVSPLHGSATSKEELLLMRE